MEIHELQYTTDNRFLCLAIPLLSIFYKILNNLKVYIHFKTVTFHYINIDNGDKRVEIQSKLKLFYSLVFLTKRLVVSDIL